MVHNQGMGENDNRDVFVSGTNGEVEPTPPEIRVSLTVKDVDPEAGRATALIGPEYNRRAIHLAFAPELAEDVARLVGHRATVEGTAALEPANQNGELAVTSIDINAMEKGPEGMTTTELLVWIDAWPPAPSDRSVLPKASFAFDVDEFLELIYEGRGRTWAESKIN